MPRKTESPNLTSAVKILETTKQQMLSALSAHSQATAADETHAAAALARASHADHDLAALTQNNQALRNDIDALKAQLLVSAAKPAIDAPAADSTEKDPPERTAPLHWALHTSYAAASDFLAMHFAKETMQTEPQADGTFAWAAASAANAATVRVTHDHEKNRVYTATLAVSLAADAPKEKLTENLQLIAAFLHTFAPGLKDAEARTTRVVNQLSTKDGSERSVFLGGDTRVTVWNNGTGLYSWRAESVGNEAGQ